MVAPRLPQIKSPNPASIRVKQRPNFEQEEHQWGPSPGEGASKVDLSN